MNRGIFVALLAAFVAWAAPAPGEALELEPLWRTRLGPVSGDAIYRLAVCPDGGVYFSDSLGRIARLAPDGRVELDLAGHDELRGVTAIACGPDGRLHAMDRSRLTVWKPSAGRMALVSTHETRRLGLVPIQLAAAPEVYLVLARKRGGKEQGIYRLSWQGGSPEPVALDVPVAGPQPADRGVFAWHPGAGKVALFPARSLAARIHDWNGRTAATALPEAAGTRIEAVLHAGYLPEGNLLVQTVETGMDGRKVFRLRLLREDGMRQDLPFPSARGVGGILQGVSSAGAAVFASITPADGIQIHAARLVRRGQAL
jgi:hypothetical protein